MPNWKKVIVSGSSAHLHHVTMSGDISGSSSSTGSFGKLEVGSGAITTTGNMTLDADGAQIRLEDGGTEFGRFSRVASDFVIKSMTGDKDLLFKGVDNTTTITALKLDMSEGGDAEFSGNVSGSATSTGSFGQIEVGGGTFTSASLAEGGVAIKDEGTTILSTAATINFTGGAVSASVDGTQTNVTIEALATEVFEDGVAIGTSIFDIELVQDSDNSTILASN